MIDLTAYRKHDVVARRRFADATQIRIGRDARNELILTSPDVSRLHAVIERRDGDYVLRDRGSANGTYLAGERLEGTRRLNDGDRIAIGGLVLAVSLPLEGPDQPAIRDFRSFLALGKTARMLPTRAFGPGCAQRTGYLVLEDERAITLRGGALHLGRGAGCDLQAGGLFGARKLALLAVGLTGATLLSFAKRAERVRVNGVPAAARTLLSDGDVLEVGGRRFVYRERERRAAAPATAGASAGPEVVVLKGDEELTRAPLDGDLLLGRSPDCDLPLDEAGISRYHARIEQRGPCSFLVRALRGQGGLAVRGREVATWHPNDGDELELGSLRLRFALPAEEDEAPPRAGPPTESIPPVQERIARERTASSVGWLVPAGDHLPVLIERDAVTFGCAPQANVRLLRGRAPDWCAVLVRSPGGFTIHNVAARADAVQLDGEPVPDAAPFTEGQVLTVCGARFELSLERPLSADPDRHVVLALPLAPEGGAAPEAPPAAAPCAIDHVPAALPGVPTRRLPRPRPAPVQRARRGAEWLRSAALLLWAGGLVAFFVSRALEVARSL